jgi:hypothetical protein
MSVRNLELSLKNTTNGNIGVEFNGQIDGFIDADEVENYDMAITRVSIPIENIQTTIIEPNDENYFVKFYVPGLEALDSTSMRTVKKYLYDSTKYTIIKPLDLLENINKTMLAVHYDMSTQLYTGDGSVATAVSAVTEYYAYTATTQTVTLPISVNGFGKTSSVYLRIYNIDTSHPAAHLHSWDAPYQNVVNIYLVSPTGTSVWGKWTCNCWVSWL